MYSIGYERTFARLKACARTAHELEARQQALRRESDLVRRELEALNARDRDLRAEMARMRSALARQRRDREKLERFLAALPDARGRELLRLRYAEGLTLPELQQALAERGIFYGQRHLERLLTAAERAADAIWPDWAEEEVRNERLSH